MSVKPQARRFELVREALVRNGGVKVLNALGAAIGAQNISLLIVLVALVLIISTQSEYFLLPTNLLNIGLALSLLGLVAIAQTVVIVSGGLDISVGSMVGLTSVAAAIAMTRLDTPLAGFAGALLVGMAAGLINGLIITVFRVNPVITTLGTLSAYRGAAFIVTNGRAVGVINADFNQLGYQQFLGVPIPILVLSAVALAALLFLRYTDLGRNIYALGGNQVAARLAGIPINTYKLSIYTLSGLICGIAGIVLTARVTSGQPSSGSSGLELESITAAVLGGCALSGGRGTIVGTLLGVIVIGTLENGLILMDVPSFWQFVAKGALLIIAVAVQEFRLARPWKAWTIWIKRP